MGFSGAIITKSSSQVVLDNHPGPTITWDNLPNSAFIVPAGVTKIVLSTYIRYKDFQKDYLREVIILKGTTEVAKVSTQDKTVPYLYCQTVPIQVISGDCFTVRSETDGDGIYITADSWFLIQIIEQTVAPKPPILR